MHRAIFAVIMPALTVAAVPALAGITYVCDPNIDAAHAGTCAYLNSTIAGLYSSTFSNANATIYVKYGNTELGHSDTSLAVLPYPAYLSALTTSAQNSGNPIQVSAVKALDNLDLTPYGNGNVLFSAALAAALGFQGVSGLHADGNTFCNNAGTASCYDGVITISNSPHISLFYRTGSEAADQYDFYSTVEHETDEVLGTASCIDTTGSTLQDGCGSNSPSAVDLFRFQSPGNLVFISTTPGAYFSYDGGQTNGAGTRMKVYNTLSNGDDYADFLSSNPCQAAQSVQDAQGCPGHDAGLDITNDGGAEIDILNAIGYQLNGQGTPPPPTPSLTNVLSGATGQATMAAGTYLAIYGSNLSTTNPGRIWTAADFKSNANGTLNMPTSLDGTSVTVNSTPAYIYFVSPTQLNIITPESAGVGANIPVVVTLNGQQSTAFNVTLQNLAPAFFAWDPGDSDNGKYLVAQHLNYTNVGKVGLFPTAPANFTTPAAPGEILQLYGTGFGPTSPPIAPGIETDKNNFYLLSPMPTATVAGLPASVIFAGLVPPDSQVYQLDVTIPTNAPNGDQALIVTVNGVQSFSGLITVQAP